jgi:hypothetical protein
MKMNKKFRGLLTALLFCGAVVGHAEEQPGIPLSPVRKLLVFGAGEATLAGFSLWGAHNSDGYAAFLGFFMAPVSAINSPDDGGLSRWVAFGGFEGMALYNFIGLDNKTMSQRTIFWRNELAWHGFFIVSGVTAALTHKRKDETTLSARPWKDGVAITMSKTF